MAATRAETQQNDVNSKQEQGNNAFHNGTDNADDCRNLLNTDVKGKKPHRNNINIEMSQFRQEGPPPVNNSEQNANTTEEGPNINKINNSDQGDVNNYNKSGPMPDNQQQHHQQQGYGLYPQRYVHPDNPMHQQEMHHQNSYFNPNMRQPYPAAKPVPRPGFQPQQRFVSSQSPPTGPTPTLNQLLQSNSVHRYQNNYDYGMAKAQGEQPPPQGYNQGWPPRPMGPYPQQQPYRNQPPPAGRGYSGSPGAGAYPPPPAASPSQQYPPQPYRHPYQMGGSGGGSNNGSFGGGGGNERGAGGGGSWSPGPQAAQQQQPLPPSQGPQQQAQPPSPSPHHQQQQQQQQHQNMGGRTAEQSPTPNAHAPDPGDLTGQNSNDSSSGGPAPGTPNSQGMRPTPSPTGSSGSRSMSPAVGQQNIAMPPRPSSGQSDSGNGPTRMSHSPMANQGGYPGGGPHMHNYKMAPHQMAPHAPPPQSQQIPPYSPQAPLQHQYPQQGNYGVRGGSMGYGSPGYQGPPGGMPPQSQYPPRGPIPNHVQYPPSPYQHKVGYSGNMPPSPGSYNSHSGGTMGPPAPHHPGMPPPPPPHHDGPMPPPPPASTPTHEVHDSSVTTTVAGSGMSNVTPSPGGPAPGSVTSIVTTGPDGASLDEASQQSTLSNASAASGDDGNCTPGKSRKEGGGGSGGGSGMMGYHSHPTTPQSTVPSPGAASLNSMHEEYPPDHSPTWPRTPASPVFNSHVPQDLYRPKKQHDSLGKLYEMDEAPERRLWLDKLLQFMEERGTPITVCPTISKNPLDLFRLYLYVKERGGFMEVTKNKIWKDIAGLLGIGASSSAAYTLRKHYTKNLLPFECHYDRGGIDPQPIINQVEASSKKKSTKAAPVPSPGSSNSQDSFPGPGSVSGGMDGYGYGYSQDYNNQQRPPSQTNQGVGVPSQVPGDNISVSNPFDDNAASPRPPRPGMPPSGGYQGQQGNYQYGEQYNQQYPGGSYPPGRPMYPPYGPESDRVYNQSSTNNSGVPPPSGGPGGGAGGPPVTGAPPSGDYNRYMPGTGTPGPPNAAGPTYPGNRGYPPPSQGSASPSGTPPTQPPPVPGVPPTQQPNQQNQPPTQQQPQQQPPPGAPPYQPQQEYYRQDGAYPGPGGYPPNAPNKTMPPPAPQPRRHPDFVKEPQPPYPPYNQRPNMYPAGWSNNNNSGAYRGQYPPPIGGTPGPQQWGQGPSRPGAPPNHQPNSPQWAGPQPPYQQPPQTQQGWGMATPGVAQSSPLRPPMVGPRPPFRPDAKPYNQMPPGHPGVKGPVFYGVPPGGSPQVKRDIVFPIDSVEATTPVLYKRRRLGKSDVAPIEAWRIMMALKSGLLAETCWALDVLNILLFDDTTIPYFGLVHLPGLMDILLEHMKKALTDMLEPMSVPPFNEEVKDVTLSDIGAVESLPDPNDRVCLLKSADYTFRSRKNHPVTICPDSDDIFVTATKRSWDVEDVVDDAVEQDSGKYIVSCFRAEFGKIPFVRIIPNRKKENATGAEEAQVIEEPKKEKTSVEKVNEPLKEKKEEKKLNERVTRKKIKTLSDVLSRIKKEPIEPAKEDKPIEVAPEATPIKEEPPTIKEEPKEPEEKQSEEEKSAEKDKTEEEPKIKCNIRDPAGTLKRRRISDYEDECYTRDEASLYLVTESQDSIARRCVCLSTILRNLTFVPGNEYEFAKSGTFLGLVGKLLLLHHEHPPKMPKHKKYNRDEDDELEDCCSSLQGDSEWWWEFLHHLRENALVSIANIAGYVDLGLYPEDISRPILDGLLHWAVCPAAQGQDPFPTVSPTSSLSPQRLALEALCKLCVTDSNVDLVIATPPYCRLERLAAVLARLLCRSEEQVLREFAVNLLFYLGAADSGMARTIAMQSPCVSQLVGFIEQAEASALSVANQHGLGALRENPDSMGTSLDMLRRAAKTLLHLAAHPDNWPLFLQQEQRLLALVMSQILDQQVASIISMVLFQVSRVT
ncbi:trithorax group protein osa isoform X2 [Cimex lectularius]|uniref:ARID domain-containing protein n=1 Tax=Cimex lectularius TaxID=79782 RepID=A0A8I6S8T8_CIMLE|nr:trithorax group protein osa isoform X2 [Cimex lectularius]